MRYFHFLAKTATVIEQQQSDTVSKRENNANELCKCILLSLMYLMYLNRARLVWLDKKCFEPQVICLWSQSNKRQILEMVSFDDSLYQNIHNKKWKGISRCIFFMLFQLSFYCFSTFLKFYIDYYLRMITNYHEKYCKREKILKNDVEYAKIKEIKFCARGVGYSPTRTWHLHEFNKAWN